MQRWFGGARTPNGLGILTGPISGNLEMTELEGRAINHLEELRQLAHDTGLGELWERATSGWEEYSPSGGVHWFYRLPEPPPGNQKIASRPSTPEELAVNPGQKIQVLAETRGTGGWVIVAPSNGTTHDTGRPWTITRGGPETAPLLTLDEREQLHGIIGTLHEPAEREEQQQQQQQPRPARNTGGVFGAVSPGDDYENKVDWAEILEPEGWTLEFQRGRTRYWVRPGKEHGFSATTGRDPARDRLWVFSSSTDFDTEIPYTKFGAYAFIHHGGDHSRAAAQLRAGVGGISYGSDGEISTGGTPWNATPQPPAGQQSTSPTAFAPADQPNGYSPQAPAFTPTTITPGTSPAGPASGGEDFAPPAISTEGNLATVTELHPVHRSTLAYSDDGNASLLIHEHGHLIRYNPDRGRWLLWDGARWRWQPKSGGRVRELAKTSIRGINIEGNATARTWKKKSLGAGGITAMLLQAETDPRVVVETDQLDAHGWELNTPGGIVDLRTGKMTPSNPDRLHTKITEASPDHDADRATFYRFLENTFPGETGPDLIGYMQRVVGYAAIGEVREHLLPIGYGEGGNGKGTLFETVAKILGDYATSAPAGFLMKQPYQNHKTELADLWGARLVLCSEDNEGDKFDEAKMKLLVGGDTIKANFMRQDLFEFAPTHQILMMVNHRPGVESGGRSFWRRARLIPFTHTVPDEQIIVGLERTLREEHGPAILAWIVEGAVAYAAGGLQEPAIIREATQHYKEEVDTVARFLEDECEITADPTPGFSPSTSAAAVKIAYDKYCESNGDTPVKGRNLAGQLAQHGALIGRGAAGVRVYHGLQLLRDKAKQEQRQREQDEHDPYGGDRGGH